jgi:hypothetical protein
MRFAMSKDQRPACHSFACSVKKMVVPMVSLEVVDDQDNAIGYLHARGTCKEEWLKANPQVKA